MIQLIGISGLARSGKDTTADVIKEYLIKNSTFCHKYNLADELKKQVNKIMGWNDRHAYGDLKEEVTEKVISTKDIKAVLWDSFDNSLRGKTITTYDKIEVDYNINVLVNAWLCVMQANGVVNKSWLSSGLLSIKASPRMMYQLHGTDFARNCISDAVWFDIAEEVAERKGGVMIVPDIRFLNEAAWIMKQGGILIAVDRPSQEKISSSGHISEKFIPKIKDKAMYVIDNDGTIEDLREEVKEIMRNVY